MLWWATVLPSSNSEIKKLLFDFTERGEGRAWGHLLQGKADCVGARLIGLIWIFPVEKSAKSWSVLPHFPQISVMKFTLYNYSASVYLIRVSLSSLPSLMGIVRYVTSAWCCKLIFCTVYSQDPATFEGIVPQNIIILFPLSNCCCLCHLLYLCFRISCCMDDCLWWFKVFQHTKHSLIILFLLLGQQWALISCFANSCSAVSGRCCAVSKLSPSLVAQVLQNISECCAALPTGLEQDLFCCAAGRLNWDIIYTLTEMSGGCSSPVDSVPTAGHRRCGIVDICLWKMVNNWHYMFLTDIFLMHKQNSWQTFSLCTKATNANISFL